MGVRAAILLEADYEDLEYWYPLLRLAEAGISAETVAPEKRMYLSKHGYPARSTATAATARRTAYDAVIVPGGWAPDKMRRYPDMVAVVKKAAARGKVVASICHGGSMLVSADCVRGRRITSVRAIRDDLAAAGARWRDERVVRDGNFITAQTPADLPEFMKAVFDALKIR